MGASVKAVQSIRGVECLLGVAVFGLIIYILSAYQFDNVVKFMLFNGIWTGFVATPYLALAPVHYPRIAGYVVVPIIEVVTFILWLVGTILIGIDLPPANVCKYAGCEAMLATVVISAVEVALYFATSVFSIVSGVQKHQRHVQRRVDRANRASATPETAEASGAVENV